MRLINHLRCKLVDEAMSNVTSDGRTITIPKRSAELARRVVKDVYCEDELALMSKLPDGWLDETYWFSVKVSHRSLHLSFSGKHFNFEDSGSQPFMRLPRNFRDDVIDHSFHPDLFKDLNDFKSDLDKFGEDFRVLSYSLKSIIDSVSTIQSLIRLDSRFESICSRVVPEAKSGPQKSKSNHTSEYKEILDEVFGSTSGEER